MPGMVENVARAIDPFAWIAGYGNNYRRTDSIRKAKEAIEAMREPTEGMVDAAYAFDDSGAQLSESYEVIYTVMIDAALKEAE